MPALGGGASAAGAEPSVAGTAATNRDADVEFFDEATIKKAKGCIFYSKSGWLGYHQKRAGVIRFTKMPKGKTTVPRAW